MKGIIEDFHIKFKAELEVRTALAGFFKLHTKKYSIIPQSQKDKMVNAYLLGLQSNKDTAKILNSHRDLSEGNKKAFKDHIDAVPEGLSESKAKASRWQRLKNWLHS